MTLEVTHDGPCTDHPCDNCATCRRGRCCRKDNPDYRLPGLGEWDGPIYGDLGVLVTDGSKLECHCCGAWHGSLYLHVIKTHGLSVEEYRAIFGLRRQQPLIGPATQAKHRTPDALEHLRKIRKENEGNNPLVAATPEQRSVWGAGLTWRPQALQNPALKAIRSQGAAKGHHTKHERWAREGLSDAEAAQRERFRAMAPEVAEKGRRIAQEALQDPATREAWRKAISDAHGGRVIRQCVICKDDFEVIPSSPKKMCGKASCIAEHRRQVMLAHPVSQRPEVAAKIAAAMKARPLEKHLANLGAAYQPDAKVEVVCQRCGKRFMRKPSAATGPRFCSRECHDLQYRDATCKNGHLWTPETTRYLASGTWVCALCRRERAQRYRARLRSQAGEP